MAESTHLNEDPPETEAATPAGPLPAPHGVRIPPLRRAAVILMLVTSSMFMALAWLGHLRFQEWPFLQAFVICWLLVLPEYLLNVTAIRLGYGAFTGAQMAAARLCSGVVWIALVSHFVLGESLSAIQLTGFGIMLVAVLLIAWPGRTDASAGDAA
jgi:uncharacterized protein (DUF486 family)